MERKLKKKKKIKEKSKEPLTEATLHGSSSSWAGQQGDFRVGVPHIGQVAGRPPRDISSILPVNVLLALAPTILSLVQTPLTAIKMTAPLPTSAASPLRPARTVARSLHRTCPRSAPVLVTRAAPLSLLHARALLLFPLVLRAGRTVAH